MTAPKPTSASDMARNDKRRRKKKGNATLTVTSEPLISSSSSLVSLLSAIRYPSTLSLSSASGLPPLSSAPTSPLVLDPSAASSSSSSSSVISNTPSSDLHSSSDDPTLSSLPECRGPRLLLQCAGATPSRSVLAYSVLRISPTESASPCRGLSRSPSSSASRSPSSSASSSWRCGFASLRTTQTRSRSAGSKYTRKSTRKRRI